MRTERTPAIVAERYSLQTLLDRTSVGMVWLATDIVLDRTVTVTLIDPGIAGDERCRTRLFDNARALAAAAPTRLVRLLDAGLDADMPFVVTERIPGDTLADALAREGPLPPGRAASIVADVLDGVREADRLGLARLDVAPSTVAFDDRGRVRIRDTGIAHAVAGPDPDDARDDVAAAGRLLFELLTGRPPGDGDDPHRVDAPRSVRSVLARSLTANGDRFGDAASMAEALRNVSRDADAHPNAPVSGRPTAFRTWFAVPLVVAAVVGLMLAAGLWVGRLEIGGPVLIRVHDEAGERSQTALPVADVGVLDPFGDGAENDDDAADVADGDPATVWRSENYWDGTLNKPGVGLVLDLGDERTVTAFRLESPAPGFRFSILVGDDPDSMVEDAASAGAYTAPDAERGLEPRTGRYVVVWITSVVGLPDGSHRAEISDVRIAGST